MAVFAGVGGCGLTGLTACRGEAHLDVEATLWPGTRGERGVVGAGDGMDDRQPKPVPAGVADSLAAKLLERLEEALEVAGRDR